MDGSLKRTAFENPGFNAGPRNCLGKPMALFEVRLVLAHVLQVRARGWGEGRPIGGNDGRARCPCTAQRFTVRGRDAPDTITYVPTLTMPIKSGLWVAATERVPAQGERDGAPATVASA